MEVINYALFILTVAMLIITAIQYYKQILKKNQEVLLIANSILLILCVLNLIYI